MEHEFEHEHGAAAPKRDSQPEAAGPLPLQQAAGNAAFTKLVRQVQRKELGSQGAGPLDPEIGSAIESERGGGAPLAGPVKSEMEHHFGMDLSAVRVHSGSTATTLARSVQAEAFTTGTDIFFGKGSPDASSSSGKELLAHELTHVVQQSSGAGGAEGTVSHPGDATEVQAREVGRAVASAGPAAAVQRHEDESAAAAPGVSTGMHVHRQEEDEEEG